MIIKEWGLFVKPRTVQVGGLVYPNITVIIPDGTTDALGRSLPPCGLVDITSGLVNETVHATLSTRITVTLDNPDILASGLCEKSWGDSVR